jgi:hypothetical protein
LSEATAGWTFSPPIWRVGYLIRQPAEAWIGQLRDSLHYASWRSDPGGASVVLNNLAFVLFKAGMANEAMLLCRAHYRGFAARPNISEAQLAVQPWINEGRVLASQGEIAAARRRLLLGPRPDAVKVDEWTLSPVDADTVNLCRNVAVVDGFKLELRAGGLDGADAYLTEVERRGVSGSLPTECRLQLALARGKTEEAVLLLDRLSEPSAYLPMLACYGAAIALATADQRKFASNVLLLVALLDGWTETEDDVASILHGLLWLRRIGGVTYRTALGASSQDYLRQKVSELGDEELQCLLAGRRYNPLPEGSSSRSFAVDLLREALMVLRSDRITF